MLRLTLKNLAANRIRLALTAFAVVLATSFVVSSFVLTDGLRSSFGDLSSDIVGGTDYQIRHGAEPTGVGDEIATIDNTLLEAVRAVPGVDAAGPIVTYDNLIRPVKADGTQISVEGPPIIVGGAIGDPRLSSLTVTDGAPVDGPGQFTMNQNSADQHGFEIGERYRFITPDGTTELTMVGATRFGSDGQTLGATLIEMDLDELASLAEAEIGGGDAERYQSIAVALAAGADRGAVEQQLAGLATGLEVVDQATLEAENRADFNEGLDIFNNVLLGFAGISLFVSIFMIANTFSIVLGQRTRELALLRTVGADPGQIRRSVLIEAVVIGLVASALGVLGGVGLTYGINALFDALGVELPDAPIVVSTRTVVVAFVVGVGTTVLSAFGPARKAATVPPVAALRDGAAAGASSPTVRILVGTALAVLGLVAGSVGLFSASGTSVVIALLAGGAAAIFFGVTLLSPALVAPVNAVVGWPGRRLGGVGGDLAGRNASRNPRRTASTAAALMIGLAVVSTTLVVGESVKARIASSVESAVQADHLVFAGIDDVPDGAVERLAALDEVDSVVAFHDGWASRADGELFDVGVTDLAAAAPLFDLDIRTGQAADPTVVNPVLVANEEAAANDLTVGDTVTLRLGNQDPAPALDLTVVGIFHDDLVVEEPYLTDLTSWTGIEGLSDIQWAAIGLVDGVDAAAAEAAYAPVLAEFPQIETQSGNGFAEEAASIIDGMLTAVNALVVLAVVIALVGIANTLALSVFERTRELGLLRAVGMSRRQVRGMIRAEAALVALFGAVLGVAVGILFGWGAVQALPASVGGELTIPYDRIAILMSVAGLAGLLAAWGPARRAGRLDVLDAIAS